MLSQHNVKKIRNFLSVIQLPFVTSHLPPLCEAKKLLAPPAPQPPSSANMLWIMTRAHKGPEKALESWMVQLWGQLFTIVYNGLIYSWSHPLFTCIRCIRPNWVQMGAILFRMFSIWLYRDIWTPARSNTGQNLCCISVLVTIKILYIFFLLTPSDVQSVCFRKVWNKNIVAGVRLAGLYGCPICGIGLTGGELDTHYNQELDYLTKISLSMMRSPELARQRYPGSPGPGMDQAPRTRWDVSADFSFFPPISFNVG